MGCLLTKMKEHFEDEYGDVLDENDPDVQSAILKFTAAFRTIFDFCDEHGVECIEDGNRVISKALMRCYNIYKPKESSEKRVLNSARLHLDESTLTCDNGKSLYETVQEVLDEEPPPESTTSGTPPAKKVFHADKMAGKSIADLLRALRHLKLDN